MNPPFDRGAVLARFEHDADLVREMVRLFHESSAAWLEEIRAALAKSQPQEAVRVAHTLKGSVGNFLAGDAAAAAAKLEKACRADDLAAAQAAFADAEAETQRLNAALTTLLTP